MGEPEERGKVIDLKTKATIRGPVKYDPNDVEEHCPQCGGVWWKMVVSLLGDEEIPTVTGWKVPVVCANCSYEITFPGGTDYHDA